MPNEIKTAERIMESDPDSALHILQHMHTEKLMMTSSDRALYGLLYFNALDKNKLTLQPDSLINFSLEYYQNSNDKPRRAACFFYKARMYKSKLRYEEATTLYLKALDNSQDKKDYNMLGKIYGDLGDICAVQKDFKESREKFKLAINCFNHAGKTIDASYRLLDIGRTYHFAKDYKIALKYYRLALAQTKDSILCGVALQEIGSNYYWSKQYDSAQFYLRRSLLFPYKTTNYAIRCYNLADLFFDIEKYDSAYLYASIALKHPANFFTQRDCYRILANSEFKRGNFKQMAIFMTQYQACSDSVRKVETQTKTTVLEDIHQTSEAASKTKKYLIILGWMLPLIVLISLYILYRLRKRNKGKEKQLEEAEVQIVQKQNLLVDSLIQKIEDSRVLHAAAYKKAALPQREQMDKELYNSCLHINDWDVFKKLMNKTFNDIITTLEYINSDLTRKDLIWCCLFLLDVPTTDLVLVLEIQPVSLYKLKQRLSQKLNLNNVKELELFLKTKSEGK